MALNLPVAGEVKAPTKSPPDRSSRAADLRTALLLTYITLSWMTIEGAASLVLGWSSKSLLLEAFGIGKLERHRARLPVGAGADRGDCPG